MMFTMLAVLFTAWLTACGESAPPSVVVEQGPGDDVGYKDDVDVVVSGGGESWIVKGEPGSECVKLNEQDPCVSITDIKRQKCGDANAQADVVIVDGQVVDVICYPPQDEGIDIQDVQKDASGNTALPQNANNSVIIFDHNTDGTLIKGDVRIDAENVSIIGNGIDKTIIDGNVTIASNNAHLRGLTINGNVTFEQNANITSIAFCKIKGNLHLEANGTSVLNSQVFGNLHGNGNNLRLVNVGVGGNWEMKGTTEVCSGNYAFEDNGDLTVTPEERGAELTCVVPQ